MTDERRRSPRIAVDLRVEFKSEDRRPEPPLAGRTINVSDSGARLHLGVTLDEGERGVLVLDAPAQVIAVAVVAQDPTEEDRRSRTTRVQFWQMGELARSTLDAVLSAGRGPGMVH